MTYTLRTAIKFKTWCHGLIFRVRTACAINFQLGYKTISVRSYYSIIFDSDKKNPKSCSVNRALNQ
jgi:hypothetical protein